jgi:16S rRNA (uracil1498-N3)-methyltransferase
MGGSDRIVLFNGNGSDFEGYFKILARDEAVIFVDKERKIKTNSKNELHLFQGIIKRDFELIVEKCTEIGVSAFHPIVTERTEKKDLNIERIKRIAIEATEQSGRGDVPEIFEVTDLKNSIENFDGQIYVMDMEGVEIKKIKGLKNKSGMTKIGILIGPEGGWTENERDLFEHKKIKNFSLGPQTLRAETAAIVASALILLK